jgi:hypothetical protein
MLVCTYFFALSAESQEATTPHSQKTSLVPRSCFLIMSKKKKKEFNYLGEVADSMVRAGNIQYEQHENLIVPGNKEELGGESPTLMGLDYMGTNRKSSQ